MWVVYFNPKTIMGPFEDKDEAIAHAGALGYGSNRVIELAQPGDVTDLPGAI